MHLTLILLMFTLACTVRLLASRSEVALVIRWQRILGLFVFPPLLLLLTALAILDMGQHGQMLGLPVGRIGLVWAFGFLGFAALCLMHQLWQSWRVYLRIANYPLIEIQGQSARLLKVSLPFAARIGFWNSELVVSQGLLDFSAEHIAAVLSHEQAHVHYRDTFWFFWLSWLRQLTRWLPNTEALWQELLLLREMRADCWAAQSNDPLVVAEALFQMAQAPILELDHACAALSADLTRLEERIDALLSNAYPAVQPFPWLWLGLAGLPILTILLHQ